MAEIISNPLIPKDYKDHVLHDLELIVKPISVVDYNINDDGPRYDNEPNLDDPKGGGSNILTDGNPVMPEKRAYENAKLTTGIVSVMSLILSCLIASNQVTEVFSIIDLTNPLIQVSIGTVFSIISGLAIRKINN